MFNKLSANTSLGMLLLVGGMAILAPATANAVPLIDGNLQGFAEGYTQGWFVDFRLDDGFIRSGGELYLHEEGSILYVGFSAPLTINDNTWGVKRSQGWKDAGVAHDFEKLQKSDAWKWETAKKKAAKKKAAAPPAGDPGLTVTGGDNIALELDYLGDDSKIAEVKKADQGGADVSGAFMVSTSLEYNLANFQGAIDPYRNDTFDFSTQSNWLFGVAYEWKLDNSLIIGNVTIANVLGNLGNFHMSPIMFAGKRDTTTIVKDPISPPSQTPIPEPGTLGLFGLGLAGLALLRRWMH